MPTRAHAFSKKQSIVTAPASIGGGGVVGGLAIRRADTPGIRSTCNQPAIAGYKWGRHGQRSSGLGMGAVQSLHPCKSCHPGIDA